jgi:electron transfer flavoprotein beta subunit
VGLACAEPTIRKALAIGADDAIRVDLDAVDAYQVAAQIAEVVKAEQFDVILCGIESSDFNGSTVGSMVAEFLNYPSVSAVSGLNIEGGVATITREIDGGKETVGVPAPFIAVVQKGIAKEPRIAAMRGIMQARTKVIKVVQPIGVEPLSEVVAFEPPQPRAKCIFVDAENPKKLVELLQNEAKVI